MIAFALLALPFCFYGVGPDVDSELVVNRTVKALLYEHRYVPSRFTGNPAHEFISAALYSVGGTVGTNLGSLAAALLALVALYRICRGFGVTEPVLACAAVAFHAIFFASASVTIDYLYAMAAALWGVVYLRQDRGWLAGLLFGLALGARLAYAPVIMAFWFCYFVERVFLSSASKTRDFKALVRTALASVATCCVATAILYFPAFANADYSLRFLTVATGDWGLAGYVARFAIRNAYFWGMPFAFVLVFVAFALCRRISETIRGGGGIVVLWCVLPILAAEAMYFRAPLEMGYLLPILPFVALLVFCVLRERRVLLSIFVGCIVANNLVNVLVLQPDVKNAASSAQLTLKITPGYLLCFHAERMGNPEFYFR